MTCDLAPIRLHLLGAPRLFAGGRESVLDPVDAAILAMLALDGPTSRARIISLCWPDTPLDDAQNVLRQRLSRLKKKTARDKSEQRPVATGAPLLKLADSVWADVRAFREDSERYANSDDVPPDHLDAGSSTATVETLPPLDPLLGSDDYSEYSHEVATWVADARRRWADRLDRVSARRAHALERADRLVEAIEYAKRRIAITPEAEDAHRHLMRLYYRQPDIGAALRSYEDCRVTLDRMLGLTPSAETETLARTMAKGLLLPDANLPAAPSPPPVTLIRPPQLIGRDAAWHAWDAAWAAGRVVVVSGEPGIGKSRLIEDRAAALPPVELVSAKLGDARVPYSSWARWLAGWRDRCGKFSESWIEAELARLVPGFGAAETGAFAPLRFRQASFAALAAWYQEGLTHLVIDDLQYADEASLDLLLAWCETGPRQRIAFALRSTQRQEALQAWLDTARTHNIDGTGVEEVALGLLDRDEVIALVDSLDLPAVDATAWAGPLVQATGGNPLFVIELLRAHREAAGGRLSTRPDARSTHQLPKRLGELLAQRIGQLPPDALRLVRVAAIAAADFSVELASTVLGVGLLDLADAWALLERHGVFCDGVFVHDLMLEAAAISVPAPLARALHRTIAEVLAVHDAAPARIAHHARAGEDWTRAASAFERAARAARAASRPVEAAAGWQAAAAAHRAADSRSDDAAACDFETAMTLTSCGRTTAALDIADAMLRATDTGRTQILARIAMARIHNERADAATALLHADAALALVGQLSHSGTSGEVMVDSSHKRLLMQGRLQAAIARMRSIHRHEAIDLLDADTLPLHLLDKDERIEWHTNRALALDYADRRSEALLALEAALDEAVRIGRWDLANAIANDKAIAEVHLNRLVPSVSTLQTGIAHGERAGLSHADLALDRMTLAGNLRDLGEFDRFFAIADPLAAELREAGRMFWATHAENDRAGAWLWLGRHHLAQQTARLLDDSEPAVSRAARLLVRAKILRFKKCTGRGNDDPADLVRRAEALLRPQLEAGRSYLRLKLALALAEDLPPAEAAARAAAIESEGDDSEQRMLSLHALVFRIQCLLRAGETKLAGAAALHLVQRVNSEGSPAGIYAPEVWWTAHRGLASRDATLADACLCTAATWIERVAANHVPEVFQSCFRDHNPINVDVRAAWSRRGRSAFGHITLQ